jgi:SOS response regulatory protein OraA/RecX
VPRVTALVHDRAGRHVLVELDGAPWRRIPLEVAARAGLAVQDELDRPALRRLRRELLRAESLQVAVRALQHRDRSRSQLRSKLRSAGVAPTVCERTLDVLTDSGLLDDARFAHERARVLAERGSGDALIRADLLAAGIDEGELSSAVNALDSERDRALRVVAARGESPATARWLARHGFEADAIQAALAGAIADEA